MNLASSLLAFFVFQTNSCIVVNKQTKENIPYSTIKFLGNNEGLYANENGLFYLTNIKADSLEISSIGYHSLKIKKSELKDTIFLNPKIEFLPEISLDFRKTTKKIIGLIEKRKTLSWHVTPKTEIATLIRYKTEFKNAYLDKIHIPIGKKTIKKEKENFIDVFPVFKSVFRVNIYSNYENKPDVRLLDSEITINCDQDTNETIFIDLSNKKIKFPKEGLFIAIEMIGKIEDNTLISDTKGSILPSFQFTKKKSKDIITSSYLKANFVNNKWSNIKNDNNFYSVSDYNMAISIELKVYE